MEGIPAPLHINGKWDLTLGDVSPRRIDYLYSWTDDPQTRHFSGSGIYDIDFILGENYVNEQTVLQLNPGKVGVVAEIFVNDIKAGTVWMREQNINITDFVKKGRNHLRIKATNLLINRVSAMTKPLPVPKEIRAQYGGALELKSMPREFGYDALPASGLLGPVRIEALKKVKID